MEEIIEYKNLIWIDAEHKVFNAEFKTESLGWIPYTCSAEDTGIGKQIWDIRDTLDIAEYVPPALPSLEELREQKHSELKSIMKAKRNALTCEYNNDVFDCNEQAQSNMTSLMGFANLGMTEFSIRSTNEHTHVLTSTQLVELATIMSKTVNELYSEYWQYKNSLYECETKEEVDNIRWE